MVLFNYATKEITAKVVYYGPGLCGKTTNLQFIYDSLPSNNKSKMLSLATKTDRTLFFDFLPLDIGKIRGMRTKLQLYTVPGQVYYNSTRQLVLKGADGVVFVADSQDFALDANLESLQNLEDNLKRQGIRISEIPLVMQYNKRDLPGVLPVEELDRELNSTLSVPRYESVATTGLGVEEALRGITQLVLSHLVAKYGLEGSEPLEREIRILNPAETDEGMEESASVWADDAAPGDDVYEIEDGGNAVVIDEAASSDLPLVRSELLESPAEPASNPFDEVLERFESFQKESPAGASAVVDVPLPRIEAETPSAPHRRASDGLVREVTLPLNLTLDELKKNRKLRLKITLEVNILS
jgi:mutual gliding-motility protein MglA